MSASPSSSGEALELSYTSQPCCGPGSWRVPRWPQRPATAPLSCLPWANRSEVAWWKQEVAAEVVANKSLKRGKKLPLSSFQQLGPKMAWEHSVASHLGGRRLLQVCFGSEA